MNINPYITIVGWETRNWRHHQKAVKWCKDFGLEEVNKHVCVGELYAKEMDQICSRFKGLFTGKTERFFFATMCQACFNESMKGLNAKKKIKEAFSFELIHVPKNG